MPISDKTLEIHKDKLYQGYVTKAKEVSEKLKALRPAVEGGESPGNQVLSELRNLKAAETFANNGVYLHEWYFKVLGGDGDHSKAPELSKALSEKWGDVETFIKYMTECGMAARGWALLVWNPMKATLSQFNCDAHDQGGVQGTIPIIVLDVYEHAYFIDYGSDRKSYIADYWAQFNWAAAEEMYLKVRDLKL